MNFLRVTKPLAFLLLALVFLPGCRSKEPSRWDKAQEESTRKVEEKTTAPTGKPFPGSAFNKFFPPAGGGYDVTPTQEKEGFAEHKLKKEGKEVAMLSISDTVTNPSAAEKFKQSTAKIAGYPAMDVGSTASALLVANRFQVKVLSRAPSFTKSDRETWLQKFNLAGISSLK